MRDVPPGDDTVPVPPPVDEVPPHDRFCDLVMTGGVASGVVYPWAIVEIARAYHFRQIGGTSVGAIAAALAAAAEYGRRVGFDQSFEVLRRAPGALGEVLDDKRTRMLSLFQANKRGQRLIRLWGLIMQGGHHAELRPGAGDEAVEPTPKPGPKSTLAFAAGAVVRAYRGPITLGALCGLVPAGLAWWLWPTQDAKAQVQPLVSQGPAEWVPALVSLLVMVVVMVLLGGLLGLLWALWRDIRFGVIDNNLGLCKGGSLEPAGPEGERPGLCEWLHEGIQSSADLKKQDRPLTFRDLWCAPTVPGAPHLRCDEDDLPRRRSINLQLITTNVTHGRPYRLPLQDTSSRLFFKRDELKDYFPAPILDALVAVSRRYEKKSGSDPASIPDQDQFYEMPGPDLPLVVAARLSLSFPLLFSAVPLWAMDYEAEPDKRALRRCLFTDGGASSNFPIHLFDEAIPGWPTFGMWLDRKQPGRPPRKKGKDTDVWLPKLNGEGRADNWERFDPEAIDPESAAGVVRLDSFCRRLKFLFGYLRGIATSAVDWRDRTSLRLPHVRNRVARLRLEPWEGGLHIGMSRPQILDMAHRYGTTTGQLFVRRYVRCNGDVSKAWREQRWVRLGLLIDGLRERLDGLKASADGAAHSEALSDAIERATRTAPVRQRSGSSRLRRQQAASLQAALLELERLEAVLRATEEQAFKPLPKAELRLRAPL